MAGKKPTGDLVTRISLDGAQPVQTLKSLRAEVSSTTSAWKAHAAEMRAAGDQLGAAKAQYDGLSQVIEKQKGLLSQQKDELQKLKQAQSEVDASTEKGKREYEGYASQIAKAENDIAKATSKLASLSTQQEKAKQSLGYYESGLAKAQTELRNLSSSSSIYVQRLEAEGKQEEANKVKLESLGTQYNKLTDIYRIQSNELTKIAQEAGKSSDAYRIQKERVDQTATSLAKTKTQMNELSESMKQAHPSVFDRIKSKITGVNSETKRAHSSLKDMFMGSFLGNALSNALGYVTGQLHSIYSDGMKANESIEKINARFKAMGNSSKDIKELDEQLSRIKTNTAMNSEEVANLQTKMMNWSVIGKKGALEMAEGIAAVGDNSRMSGDKISALSAQLFRVGQSGKVTSSQISRIAKSAPSLYQDLAKSAGMSEEQMKKTLASGDVTQKQFQEWVAGISKSAGKAYKDFDTTQEGSTKRMQDSWTSLKKAMTKPLYNARTSGLNALSDFMTSPGIQKGAENIGKAISQGLGFLSKHKKSISDIAQDLFKIGGEIAKDVWKTFSSIMGAIADAFGKSSKHAKDAKDPVKQVARGFDTLAQNKTAIKVISDAIVAMVAIKTFSPIVSGMFGIADAAKKGYKGVKSVYKGIKSIDGISKLKGAEKALSNLGSNAVKVAYTIKQSLSDALSGQSLGGAFQSLRSAGGFGNLTTLGKTTTALAGAGVAIDAGSSIVSAIKDKAGSKKQYQDAGKGIGSLIGGGIGMWFGGPAGAAIGSQIGKVAGDWGGQAVKSFQKGWTSKKPPKKFWSLENLGWSTHDIFNKIGSGISSFWNSAKSKTQKGTKKLGDVLKDYTKVAKKEWDQHYSGVEDLADDFSKNMKKDHNNLFDALKDTADDKLGDLKKKWSKSWHDIKTNTGKTWDSIKKGSNKFGDNMNSWFAKFSKGFKKSWSNLGDGMKSIFSKAWSGIKNIAKNGMNGLIDILNSGIGAVNNVIHFFGGKAQTIKKVGHVRFASGTGYFGTQRRAITTPTLAMVNDGNDSPETGNKEALYRPSTGDFGIFQGRNVSTILQPGDEIFNASETKMLMQSMGMAHFAKGTGFFSDIGKGISNAFGGIASWAKNATSGLKKFFDLASKIIKSPGSYLNSLFSWTGLKGINPGAITEIAKGGFNKGKQQAGEFWKTLWSMASGSLNDGGGAEGGLLGAVEKYGKGHPYVWGATGPDAFDCSGLVMYALEKSFHKSFPHYSGSQYNASVPVSNPQPGDLVFFGPGGSTHVGVYAGGGKYYSAMSPGSGIGMSPVSSGPGVVSYRRVPGLNTGGSTHSDVKATTGLQAFVKNVVGSGFFSFISKLGNLFGLDGGGSESNPGGSGVDRWGELVKKALRKNGLPTSSSYINAWLRQIKTESGGNPNAIGGNDGLADGNATGLLQVKPGTFRANSFSGHGNIMNGYDNILAAIRYAKRRYGATGMLGVIGHGHGYANGGIATEPSIFGEAGPEMAIPLSAAKSSRTYELIGKTAAIAASRDNINVEQVDNALSKKIDGLLTSINALVEVLTGETQVVTNITMDGQKVGSQVAKYVSREMGHRMKGRVNRLSGY